MSTYEKRASAIVAALVGQPADVEKLKGLGVAELNPGWIADDNDIVATGGTFYRRGDLQSPSTGSPYNPANRKPCYAPIPLPAEICESGTAMNKVVRAHGNDTIAPPGYRKCFSILGKVVPDVCLCINSVTDTWERYDKNAFVASGILYIVPISPGLPPFASVETPKEATTIKVSLSRKEMLAYNEANKIGGIIQKRGETMTLEQFSEFLQEIGDMVQKMDESLDPEDFDGNKP